MMTPTPTLTAPPAHDQPAPTPFWATRVTASTSPVTPQIATALGARVAPLDAEVGTARRSQHATATAAQVPRSGSVDVVVADLTADPAPADGPDRGDGRPRPVRWRDPGVLSRCHRLDGPHGELVDPSGAIVAVAQNADLLCLQTSSFPPPRCDHHPRRTTSRPRWSPTTASSRRAGAVMLRRRLQNVRLPAW